MDNRESNNMRTQEEILNRIEDVRKNDFFGAETGDLIPFLTFENAKPFLKEGITEDQWNEKTPTEESIKNEAKEYLPFAWEKANDMRGISANRSIDHMRAYAWLLGDEILKEFDGIAYEHYGKEKLIYISDVVGFDWKSHDNGERTNGYA